MQSLQEVEVVTCFLRNRGDVLLLKRSGQVGSYRGLWGAVSGHVEGRDPDGTALREIAEETGLESAVHLVKRGERFSVDAWDLGKRWTVHPYLFDCESREARLDWESVSADWTAPTSILRRDCVPLLWRSYEHVAPTLESVASDRTHGSSWIALRALEVLRDRAGSLAATNADFGAAWRELEALAEALVEAQPSMVALENRVRGVLFRCQNVREAIEVEREAHREIGQAIDAAAATARSASELVSGKRVLTLSRSETVSLALERASPAPRVVVAESRPGGEGVAVAEALVASGLEAVLVPDAGVAAAIDNLEVELVLVGADRVLPSGDIVNKVGTRLAALAAREAGIPFYCAAGTDKVASHEGYPEDERFERTPGALVTGIVTELGVLSPDRLSDLSAR
jgi:translation initiation factor 2B subunit (eIF-2B alpha/beta/delta family)